MKLKFVLIILFSLLLIPGWSGPNKRQKHGNYGNDLIGKFEKNLDELNASYDQVRQLMKKKENEIEKKRNINSTYSSSANTVTNNTNSTKSKRDAANKKISKLKQQVNDEQSDVEKQLKLNAELSVQLQKELTVLGIGDNFDFPYLSDTLIKTYMNRGVSGDYDKEDMQLNKAEDPAVTIRSAKFDIQTLRDSGVDLSAPNPVPDTYLQYRTFFRFYSLLDFYRKATGDFNRLKDPHAKMELTRRYKKLKPAAVALNRLLEKNAPHMAKKVNLPKMMTLIEKHFKSEAFKDLGVFDDLLNSKNLGIKKGASDFDKYLSENAKKKNSPLSANASQRLDNSIRVVMKESFDILDKTAADLRKASTRDQMSKRGKRKKDQSVDDQPELLPETLLFRNADAQIDLPKRAEDEVKETDGKAVEESRKPEKPQSVPPSPKAEDKPAAEPEKDAVESPAKVQKESTTITEKAEWE